MPFAYDLGPGALSAEAIADPPPFERCRAVAAFDEVARKLVHGLKYRDQLELAALDGRVDGAGRRRTRRRRRHRRAGAAPPLPAVVAALQPVGGCWPQAVAARRRQAASPPTLLKRIRATAQQVGLSADERDRNVRGAFRVMPAEQGRRSPDGACFSSTTSTRPGRPSRPRPGRCSAAGAGAVDVLVFARVVRGGD